MKISVFMIAKNEETNIVRALSSVSWADEIVVVDSGSTDKTLELAKRFTNKILHHDFKDYADQKNYALAHAKGDWLLSLDADEELTPELQKEIREAIKQKDRFTGYRIRRVSNIFGRWFRFTGTQDDKPLRLFRAGAARFSQPVHEKMDLDGPCGELRSPMKHFTYPTARGYIQRFNRYTSMEAELLSAQPEPGFTDFWLKPAAVFFRLYIWKLGFLDGVEGFLFSLLSGCYVFTKHAKRWENARARRG